MLSPSIRNVLPAALVVVTILAILAGFGTAAPAHADSHVVLTVTGKISAPETDGRRDFTLRDLEQLGMESFESENAWMDGRHKFGGVPFRTILDAVGAAGDTLHAVALNDYAVDIPVSALIDRPALLVTRIDGKEIPVREKGPLWILYPQSADYPEYRKVPFINYMVWQLRTIDVR